MIDPERERLAREISTDFGRYFGGAEVDLVTGEIVPVRESLRRSVDHQIGQAAIRAARLCVALSCGWCALGYEGEHRDETEDGVGRWWHFIPKDAEHNSTDQAITPYCSATQIRDLFGFDGEPCPLPDEVRVAKALMGQKERTR